MESSKREEQDLTVLHEIGKTLGSSNDLKLVIRQIMGILHEKMGMERGTVTLLDDQTKELFIQDAYGLDEEEIKRGRYLLGEGITGKVVAAGEPFVVPNVGNEPLFLNRTGSRDVKRKTIAFICIPIKLDQKTIGALSVDPQFREDDNTFNQDIRLLTIISSMIAQAVRIHRMVQKEKEKLQTENKLLKQELKKKFHPTNIIGESKRMMDVYASIELVSQTSATVMLRGESGTGKELVAHAIHYNSDRPDGPFIKVSCAALPETLLEAELFGYEKGAFTGAMRNKPGRFELANNGTLFLDEIGDISASTQVKLLRVLQEKEFERVGGTETLRVNIRLITATNKDLEKEVREGKFREDLYYRLNVVPVFLPSLRERKEDIPMLVDHFLALSNQEHRKNVRYIADAAMEYLMNYMWPGNVRELQNAIERSVVLCKTDTLTAELFPIPGTKTAPVLTGLNMPEHVSNLETRPDKIVGDGSLTDQVEALEKQMIMQVLEKNNGNQRQAAKALGITERILGYKVKKYGIKV
ncbi:MAG: nif-specific transcriptional activator NifA [Candidatus Omnitrophica bacterium]|nr:nif-specific transcriptional activator NifA [Candidatus Omnitrophota bacterium]